MTQRALALLGLTACAVGPDFHRPPPPGVAGYTADRLPLTLPGDGITQQLRPGAHIAATWWQLFRSPALDQLVRLALVNNPDIAVARHNLRGSEHRLRAGYGVFMPQVDASGSAVRERFSAQQFGANVPSTEFTLYTLGGTINLTPDVFGHQRRTVEALGAQVDVQCYSLVSAQLSVTGNVINTAIARAAYAEQIRATEDLVVDLRHQVDIARAQELGGIAAGSTVLAFETQLANTIATLPPLRQQLADADALLSTLLGYAPAEWRPPPIALAELALPRELPVSLPAQLVRQRPDVLIAEATLHIYSANVGVATAAMLPSFGLSTSVGATNKNAERLFEFGSFVWSFGARVLAPIFHGGTLDAQRHAAIEDFRSSLASYRRTVLAALHDVATTLSSLVHDAESVEARAHALRAATEARRLVMINYETGTAGYLDVLNADTQYQQARLGYIQAQALRLQATVSLFVALGGGWWSVPRPACPAPQQPGVSASHRAAVRNAPRPMQR